MTIYQWLCLLGVPSIIGTLGGAVLALWKQNKAIKLGLQALLRDRLLQSYRLYIERGWAGVDERSCINNMYDQYHALGKNGVMTSLHDKFLALPLNDPSI